MNAAELLLRLGPALTMVVFGVNQWMRPQSWVHYIPSALQRTSPMKPESSMKLHALGNLAFGLFLATGWHPLLGAWIAFVWWLSILPFAFKVSWAIGMRDLSITVSLLALILLLR